MKMTGIVFSNIYDDTLGELTSKRTVASLPFGGRYRQIDFILSNMVNSNITSIGVITKYNYQSLMDHLGSCEEWDLNRKNGGLYILPPFASGRSVVYKGKLEALHNAVQFLESCNSEYVVLSDSVTICNINYNKVLEEHIKNKKDITVIATTPENYVEDNGLCIELSDSGETEKILVDYPAKENSLVGMGMYIMDREILIKEVEEAVATGLYHFERDFLQSKFNKGELSVNTYKFEGKTLCNRNIPEYFKNNLALLDEEVCRDIFRKTSPIYTKVRDEVPTRYGENCEVNECLIADGCVIEGKVERSVLFRNVKIKENVEIKNSVIMQGANIGKGAYLENVIMDKDVTISEDVKLIGAENNPVIIRKGETV